MTTKQSQAVEVREIAIDSIRDDPLPDVSVVAHDAAMLQILGRIVELFGQARPVIVAPQKGIAQQRYRLVGGMDIFLAVRDIGYKQVLAWVTELSDYDAAMQFYRCELLRLDLSWENQARCLLALQELYRQRHYFQPSLHALGILSGLESSRIRDLLHGIALLQRYNLGDGTIPFPTLLRSIRPSYPEALQKELVRGLVEEEWTRRRATSYAVDKLWGGLREEGAARNPEIDSVVGVSLLSVEDTRTARTARGAAFVPSAFAGGR